MKLEAAKAAQDRLAEANKQFMQMARERDLAVQSAGQSGASAAELASHLGLSRQQIHKILKGAS